MPRRQTATPFLTAFGARIRDLRLKRGISLVQLGETSGIGKGSLSSIENGLVNPTLRVAEGLGVGTADMIPPAQAFTSPEPHPPRA
jgi:transcriptional regulator with XRE-family HTH domain